MIRKRFGHEFGTTSSKPDRTLLVGYLRATAESSETPSFKVKATRQSQDRLTGCRGKCHLVDLQGVSRVKSSGVVYEVVNPLVVFRR